MGLTKKIIMAFTGVACTLTLASCIADTTVPRTEDEPQVVTDDYDIDATQDDNYFEKDIALEDGTVVHCLHYRIDTGATGMSCDWGNAIRPKQSTSSTTPSLQSSESEETSMPETNDENRTSP